MAPSPFDARSAGLELVELCPWLSSARPPGTPSPEDAEGLESGPELQLGAGLSGEVRLLLGVVAHAARDWLDGRHPASAWRWLCSPLAALACEAAGLDLDTLRERLEARGRSLWLEDLPASPEPERVAPPRWQRRPARAARPTRPPRAAGPVPLRCPTCRVFASPTDGCRRCGWRPAE